VRVFRYLTPCALLVPALVGQVSVLTWHNDNARSGQNLLETILSPANVNSTDFGLKFTLAVDGKVDAQPLYVPALSIASATHNVVYVATENDTLYAFDADTGTQLWRQSILNGENPSDDRGCSQVTPEIGITSTPVIDLGSGPHGTIYLVAMTKDSSNNYHQRLHAIDLVTHTEEFGGPIEVQATYPKTSGVTTFVPQQYKERAALLLLNGVVYTSWTSHCDDGPYSAWIMGYNESSLSQVTVLDLTPNGNDGSIWQAGAGPAVDPGGNIYFLLANGTFDTSLNAAGLPSEGDYGNGFMNVSTNGGLSVVDYFTMSNTVSESNGDEDLGSGGAMVLPTLNDALGHPRELAVGAGKDGNAYVVDRNNMGKFNKNNDSAIYQQFALGGSVYSSPAWFNNTLFYGPVGQQLSAYPYSGGSFASPTSNSSASFEYPGTTPSISANGSSNAIVWAMQNSSPAVLHAYNAASLTTELYNSNQAANGRDDFGVGNKFMTPMIANGKVYAAATNPNVVGVFGLLNCTYSIASPSASYDSGATTAAVNVTAPSGCSWSVATTSNFITITGGPSGSGNGTVSYSIPANPGTQRVGTLLIAGNTFTITQSGTDSLVPAPSSPTPANGATGVSTNPTLSWTGSAGATSYDVYFGTSPTPPLLSNTVNPSIAPGALSTGIAYYWRVVAKASSGANSSEVWSFTTSRTAVPTVVSAMPNSGSGASQTFTLQYSDTAGAASLQLAWVYFNATLANPATQSCVLYYNVGLNLISLLNDGGSAWLTATPGTSTTLENGQCSLNVAAMAITPSGDTLTLKLPMTFQPAYGGVKNIYMYASDLLGASGWSKQGSWTVPGNPGVPAANSVKPKSGTGASRTFTLQYSDTAGAASLQLAFAYFNATLANPATESCLLYYNVGPNQINLLNDNATAWLTATPGASTTLENSHCSLNVAAMTVTPSGDTLTLKLPMTFQPAFAGAKNVYMYATDVSASGTGWQKLGTWTVP
jgi:PQQ-like domain